MGKLYGDETLSNIFCTVISLGLSAAKYTVAVQLTNSVMSLRQLSLCAMQNLGHPWSKLV